MRKRISDLFWSLVTYCPLRALPPTATQEVGGQHEQGLEYEEQDVACWTVKGKLKAEGCYQSLVNETTSYVFFSFSNRANSSRRGVRSVSMQFPCSYL